MFRFDDPQYLWLLLLIPLLVAIDLLKYSQKKKKLNKIGDKELLHELTQSYSRWRILLKRFLLYSALAMIIIMIARPQMGSKISREKRHGIETMIAIDISNSMRAEDVVPSRLEKSKLMVENLIEHFTNDKIGLIVFAGNAFIQLPITNDYISAKMFLQNISPSLIEEQGTDIGQAIHLASNSFTSQQNIGKAIILITDGEDHEGGAMEQAAAAKKKGINVFILGVGNTQGAPIPDGNGNYMQDSSGETVLSKLNESMCKEIAKAGDGTYIHVENNNAAQEKLNAELTKLQTGETESVVYSEYAEQFHIFGWIALILLLLDVLVLETPNKRLKKFKIFHEK